MPRFKKLLVLTPILTLATLIGVSLLSNHQASALSGSEFQAGRIIDDGVFFNSSSMSEGQIQEFLNAKVPVCDTWGTKPYGGTTRAAYGTSRGYPPPYICLKDYRQDTGNKSPEDMLCNGHTAGNKSAARIIKDVADSCGVSPKVLIILLQKEQSLVTDDWPWSIQYRSATGYGCPDTAPCDAQYYGFFNQVYNAARIYKYYAKYPNSFNHIANRNNNILYHPNSACGRSTVFIHNQATAGLYNYTPYQPNAAALNNLYGTGDSCSAYGNRNFWRMFYDWFGTTHTLNYSWSEPEYKLYNSSKSIQVDPGQLLPGEKYYVVVKTRNVGNATWTNGNGFNPVLLGASNPTGRSSILCNDTWLNCGRPTALKEANVDPAELATFEFLINAPLTPGSYREYFKPLAEMQGWANDSQEALGIRVITPDYSWELRGGYKVFNLAKTTQLDPGLLKPNAKYVVTVEAKNTGNAVWHNGGPVPFLLATSNPIGHNSQLCSSTWLNCARPAGVKESSVAPGQLGHFEFVVTTPNYSGEAREFFKPVAETLAWSNDISESLGLKLVPRSNWSWVSAQAWSDNSKTQTVQLNNLTRNQTFYIEVKIKNLGYDVWSKNAPYPLRLGTSNPTSRISAFCTTGWLSCNRPATMQETIVDLGQTATFGFTVKAPGSLGEWREYFRPVMESNYWLKDSTYNIYFKVNQ